MSASSPKRKFYIKIKIALYAYKYTRKSHYLPTLSSDIWLKVIVRIIDITRFQIAAYALNHIIDHVHKH
jgi:hypothetical protein